MFKTLSNIGLFRIVLDEAAFYQILCTSLLHTTSLRERTESTEAIVLSTGAIQSVNRGIADLVLDISDGITVTILACHVVGAF
jgi:hypothetical protein